jgi:TonB family protein
VDAVRHWQFQPAPLGGQAVRVKQSVEVRFALDSAPSWRLMRIGYHVTPKPREPVRETQKPGLTEYTRPDDKPCLASGTAATLEVAINRQGQPGDLQVVEEHGDGAGKAAAETVARWRFQPGRVNGSPRESTGTFLLECRDSKALGADADQATPAMKVGNGVSAPVLLHKVEPEYSEAARKAKFQGSLAVYLRVNPSGRAEQMCVVRMLGLGMDEKAMEAINQWRFRPGMKAGVAVPMPATVEVHFRLL